MELLVSNEDALTILVNIRLRSSELGEVVMKECPVCWAPVRESKLADHLESHDN
jgi:hypothetical protein